MMISNDSITENNDFVNNFSEKIEENQKKEQVIEHTEPGFCRIGFGYSSNQGILSEFHEGLFEDVFRNHILNNPRMDRKYGKDAHFFCPFRFSGNIRRGEFCTGIYCLVYDIDKSADGTEGVPDEIYERITSGKIRGLKHAVSYSFNSKEGARKFRLIFPFEKVIPLTIDDQQIYEEAYDMFWTSVLCGMDGEDSSDIDTCLAFREVNYDNKCTDIGRMYYTPRVGDNGIVEGNVFDEEYGDFLDFEFFLNEAKKQVDRKVTSSDGKTVLSVVGSKRKRIRTKRVSNCVLRLGDESSYKFSFREKGLVELFEKELDEKAVVGNRNATINEAFFSFIPLVREKYFYENEREDVLDAFIEIAFSKTYNQNIDGCPKAYRRSIEQTMESAKKATLNDKGRNYNNLNSFQKKVYDFFFHGKAFFYTTGKSLSDASLMDMLGDEVMASDFIVFQNKIYVYDEDGGFWVDFAEKFASSFSKDDKHDIDKKTKTKVYKYSAQRKKIQQMIRQAIEEKLTLIKLRFNDEESFVLESRPDYYKEIKKDPSSADEQLTALESVKNRIGRFFEMFNSGTYPDDNGKHLLSRICLEDKEEEEIWQDRNLPALSDPQDIKLAFRDGTVITYDVENKKFKKTKAKKTDMIRKEFSIDIDDFDPDVRYSNKIFDNFINNIFKYNEEKEWFQMFLGTSLLMDGSEHERLVFLYGPTRNGKSTFLERICKNVFGSNIVGPVSHRIFENTSGPNPELLSMNKRRISTISEFSDESSKVLTSAMKTIISPDFAETRNMYEGEMRTVRKKGVIVCCANTGMIPKFKADDDAPWERLAILQMPFVYKSVKDPDYKPCNPGDKDYDPNFPEKGHRIKNPNIAKEVLSMDRRAIIQWFLDGALMYFERGPECIGDLTPTMWESIKEVRYSSGDSVRNILSKYITPVDETFLLSKAGKIAAYSRIPISELFRKEEIRDFYSRKGIIASGRFFSSEIKSAGYNCERLRGIGLSGQEVEKTLCITGYRWKNLDLSLSNKNDPFVEKDEKFYFPSQF